MSSVEYDNVFSKSVILKKNRKTKTDHLVFITSLLLLCVLSLLTHTFSLYKCFAITIFFFFFFFFSFAYTTSPAAVMKLVVFFRSSKPPYNIW